MFFIHLVAREREEAQRRQTAAEMLLPNRVQIKSYIYEDFMLSFHFLPEHCQHPSYFQ